MKDFVLAPTNMNATYVMSHEMTKRNMKVKIETNANFTINENDILLKVKNKNLELYSANITGLKDGA